VRLFVAVWPPDEVIELLASLPRPEDPALKWTHPDQWHVTLRFMGTVPASDLDALMARFDALAVSGQVEARLGPQTGWFSNRILHVPVHGLDAAANAVIDATRDFGQPPDDRPFSGHLTLARARRGGADLRPHAGSAIEASWPVPEVLLVRSWTNPDRARYEILRRRSLEEAP
jgi:RNA 2',3'-cyclic 3'-phosphodiesterase